MRMQGPEQSRSLRTEEKQAELVVVGGGMAGTCCAVTAARAGVHVILVQDRPVLGGNASSEVRLWTLGATSHMHSNNRWAREGGVIDEILVENQFRNPEGNPLIFDTVLLEKVVVEPNITLLLNTAVYEVSKEGEQIASVTAFCSQNSTRYTLSAPLFCDASGDGIVGFLSGAAFRMGAEAYEEFGEKFAPSQEYGELLGHSLYFYSKDVGRAVSFVPPAFALSDIEENIPRFRSFTAGQDGCRLWWIEYGGRLDTVHDTEAIKWELWRVVYGVWDYIKNSGKFPEAASLTLEWVGHIPGKRESRRFEGDYLLRQQDLVEQTAFPDVVAFGGWSIDLHPADGIFSEKPGCSQWHSKGIYGIPYRCYYSRTVPNLFLAGRIISATHVAFGSSRVMATCAHGAQAVGLAARLCAEQGQLPADIAREPAQMERLQRDLLRTGQHLLGLALSDPEDLAKTATVTASSRFRLDTLPPDGPLVPLTNSWAMLLPVAPGPMPRVSFVLDIAANTVLEAELRVSSRVDNHTPDITLARRSLPLLPGLNEEVCLDFGVEIDASRYAFVCLMHNEDIEVHTTEQRLTGVLSVAHTNKQRPIEDIGVETFEFWKPQRRPGGRNLALRIKDPLDLFGPDNVINGLQRPTHAPNAWVADLTDPQPTLTLAWDAPQAVGRIELFFDTDFDHPMESVLMGHPENVMPFCVRQFCLRDATGRVLAERQDNHQTRTTIVLDPPVTTDRLRLEVAHPAPNVPAALFEARVYPPG